MWTLNQANQNDWPKETQKKYPHTSDWNCHEGTTQDSPSESAHVSINTYCSPFPPNKHLTCFTTFCLCGNYFLQSGRARALSLTTGLMARIRCSLSLWTGNFKPLQAEATWDLIYWPGLIITETLLGWRSCHILSKIPNCLFSMKIISSWKQPKPKSLRKKLWTPPNCLKNRDRGPIAGRESSPQIGYLWWYHIMDGMNQVCRKGGT